MAKISPVSNKYLIHARFRVEGALEKPDVIGAIFGQTEGLLGSDLEMRELQKEGKIGRIEVELERKNKITSGIIKIPTALDQSETTLIAAAIETIERIGPCDSQIEVERIEDVRGSKREYIIDRAKNLMKNIEGSANSREISGQIRESIRTGEIKEHGKEKLPCGDLSGKEIIVVEGRADVLNLMRSGIKNVIGMDGTKMPDSIKELGEEKDLILFVDGDRGGKLIIQNVLDNARVKYIVTAPEGKEVEELTEKEIFMNLRKKVPVSEFLSREQQTQKRDFFKKDSYDENKLKEISKKNKDSKKAVLLDSSLNRIKEVSVKTLGMALKKGTENPYAVVIDGTATKKIIDSAEEKGAKVIVANNFVTTDTNIKLLSF